MSLIQNWTRNPVESICSEVCLLGPVYPPHQPYSVMTSSAWCLALPGTEDKNLDVILDTTSHVVLKRAHLSVSRPNARHRPPMHSSLQAGSLAPLGACSATSLSLGVSPCFPLYLKSRRLPMTTRPTFLPR